MDTASTSTTLPVEVAELPDLTDTLHLDTKRWAGNGSFGTVYSCSCKQGDKVAVKAINFPRAFGEAEKDEFLRKMKRELGVWKRLDGPNIVPLLGKARGAEFASDHPCMVSMWMPNGTLAEYINQSEVVPSLRRRIQLIQGTAAGLEYLHSRSIIHGDFHPANILIDNDDNPRVTDFGYSQTLSRQDQLTYLWTESIRPGAKKWVAPELLHPDLFPDIVFEATLNGDIYSLGSIILFILSGNPPWKDADFENQIKELNNPPRPRWPVVPDGVWDFIERCWSPRDPASRPSAQEVLSFCTGGLERLLLPSHASDINIVLFGSVGCGKSSIINLLAGKPIAPVSTSMEPCTKRPRCYRIPIGERQFRVWDTTGFCLPRGGAINPLSPFEQAHAVFRDIADGVHLILLCARKDEINTWLRSLYWFVNEFLFVGRAPVAFVATHFDTPDNSKKSLSWWERNQRAFVDNTNIPIQSIPRVCIATARTGCDQSRQALRSLLEKCASSATPVPLRLRLSSHEEAASAISHNCGFASPEAAALVDKFSSPRNQLNIALFGKSGAGKSSVINLIAGRHVARVSSNVERCTLDSTSYVIDTPKKQFVIWDTVGFRVNGVRDGQDVNRKAVMNAVQLVRNLFAKSGIDLLVFVMDCSMPTTSELNCFRLLEEFLCEGQVPVAIVVTHLEDYAAMDRWWEANGQGLRKALRGNVIGHACITSLASYAPQDNTNLKFSGKLTESRLTVQALLEGCFSCPKGEEISVQLRGTKKGEEMDRALEEMTVENLVKYCGLTKELARDIIKLYTGNGSG